MIRSRPQPPPASVPRLGSLLHRLQRAPDSEARPQTCLDQLMIFLDDPPANVRDRWKAGAEMCTAWGIPCSGASVWRLYRAYVFEWRARLSRQSGHAVQAAQPDLEKQIETFTALRTCEILTNPHASPTQLVDLARIQVQRKALDLAREVHENNQQKKLEIAVDAFFHYLRNNREASALFDRIVDLMKQDGAVVGRDNDHEPAESDPPHSPHSPAGQKSVDAATI